MRKHFWWTDQMTKYSIYNQAPQNNSRGNVTHELGLVWPNFAIRPNSNEDQSCVKWPSLKKQQEQMHTFDNMGLANQVAVPGFGHGTPNPSLGGWGWDVKIFNNNKSMLNMTTWESKHVHVSQWQKTFTVNLRWKMRSVCSWKLATLATNLNRLPVACLINLVPNDPH